MKKIKFIKEFRVINVNIEDTGLDTTIEAGEVNDFVNDESAQWLIDNGFAEEVKESGWWKPERDEHYYYVTLSGDVGKAMWFGVDMDWGRLRMGYVFKTENAAYRYRDYLKAIATVRQDEGVLTPEQVVKDSYVYYIYDNNEFGPVTYEAYAACISVNTVPFDTKEHAQASRDKHLDEWKIIANYDWSRE